MSLSLLFLFSFLFADWPKVELPKNHTRAQSDLAWAESTIEKLIGPVGKPELGLLVQYKNGLMNTLNQAQGVPNNQEELLAEIRKQMADLDPANHATKPKPERIGILADQLIDLVQTGKISSADQNSWGSLVADYSYLIFKPESLGKKISKEEKKNTRKKIESIYQLYLEPNSRGFAQDIFITIPIMHGIFEEKKHEVSELFVNEIIFQDLKAKRRRDITAMKINEDMIGDLLFVYDDVPIDIIQKISPRLKNRLQRRYKDFLLSPLAYDEMVNDGIRTRWLLRLRSLGPHYLTGAFAPYATVKEFIEHLQRVEIKDIDRKRNNKDEPISETDYRTSEYDTALGNWWNAVKDLGVKEQTNNATCDPPEDPTCLQKLLDVILKGTADACFSFIHRR